MPCALISVMIAKICCTRIGARPSDGSSSSSRRGRHISARPMASICCSPPDSVPPFCATRSLRRGNSAEHALEVRSLLRGRAGEGAHLEVLEDRQAREDPPALGRVADAQLDELVRGDGCEMSAPRSSTVPCAGWQQPADRLERRRLAGAVGADERDDLAPATSMSMPWRAWMWP